LAAAAIGISISGGAREIQSRQEKRPVAKQPAVALSDHLQEVRHYRLDRTANGTSNDRDPHSLVESDFFVNCHVSFNPFRK
jgi:hypothetical protein